jgi:hypothetical protein
MFKRRREVNRVSQQETLGREQGLRARRMRQQRRAAGETDATPTVELNFHLVFPPRLCLRRWIYLV